MLVTNSEFKFSGAEVKRKKSSLMGRIVRAVDKGLCRMAEAGKPHADCPLLSIELALCVAQCMGRKQYLAVQTAGLA